MPLPLKVALLWHQHQPYYKHDNEFILPWVRLHAAKDYYDLPALAEDFPTLRQTINLAPSLVMQLHDYGSGAATDKIQRLSRIPAEQLSPADKREILRLFFLCNGECMIAPYDRYRELWIRAQNPAQAADEFTPQDWRDLQAWYNLTWVGQQARTTPTVAALFAKGSNFTTHDIALILDIHRKIIDNVLPVMQSLRAAGQIEISVTPLYHPIVPLLIDSHVALEAMDCALPEPHFSRPDDAETHVVRGMELYRENFGALPAGMWFSEGSISDTALKLAAKHGIRWTASDEDVLWASLGEQRHWTDKYFPRKFSSEAGTIALLFRDHALSDAVGFVYSRWQADHAAEDFCNRLRHIRAGIVEKYGEDALAHAVVPVILDGENCWEYFYQNGEQFLRELYKRLTESPDITTVTCSEATADEHLKFASELEHIRAGSWINANFKIWIGHPDDNAAWLLLRAAREAVEKRLPELDSAAAAKALEHCYIAEGSDWFWWYGDEHTSENQEDFDILFRWNIAEAYRHAGIDVPPEVATPIGGHIQHNIIAPKGMLSPVFSSSIEDISSWENAGYYEPSHTTGAMHAANELLRRVWYGADKQYVYFRFALTRPLRYGEEITVQCHSPRESVFTVSTGSMSLHIREGALNAELRAIVGETVEAAISRSAILGETGTAMDIKLIVAAESGTISFPRQGTLTLPFFARTL